MFGSIEVVITGIVGIITTIVSAFVSWVFARRKYNSEVDSQLIDNMKESLDFYKKLSDDNKERLDMVLAQNKEILEQNAKLLVQNKLVISQNEKLELEVKRLRKQVDLLTNGTDSSKKAQKE